MAFHYDITSHLIFALYNTWENSPAASALCIHSLDEIQEMWDKCTPALPAKLGINSRKYSDLNPIFMETRQNYFLTTFIKQRLSEDSSDYLMYFGSSTGVILKAVVNPELYSTVVVAKFIPQKGYEVGFMQLVDAGSKMLMLDQNSRVQVIEKHNCHAYSCNK